MLKQLPLLPRQQPERPPVVKASPVLLNRRTVRLRRIALVFQPIVVGVLLVQLHHIIVAVSFGQYRGRRDGTETAVPLYHTVERQVAVRLEAVAVDK